MGEEVDGLFMTRLGDATLTERMSTPAWSQLRVSPQANAPTSACRKMMKTKTKKRTKTKTKTKKKKNKEEEEEEEEEEGGDRNSPPTSPHAQELKRIRMSGNPSLRHSKRTSSKRVPSSIKLQANVCVGGFRPPEYVSALVRVDWLGV